VNYARRQQYRRLSRAATAAVASGARVKLALAAAGAGAVSAACAILVLALGPGLYARHWLSLAERSRVGARSEDEVRRRLTELEGEGWRLRHSLAWQARGDIDSLAIAPDPDAARHGPWTWSVRRHGRPSLTARPPGASRMSRLHRAAALPEGPDRVPCGPRRACRAP
jgi:hypothetical protein